MLRRSIGFGLALTCMLVGFGTGCGDDDDNPDGGAAAGNSGSNASGSGASGTGLPTGPRPGRSDSGTPTGSTDAGFDTEMEGFPCGSTADCTGNLRCVSAGRDFQFGICARPCSTDDDCGLEACLSLSNQDADLHCVNFVRQEFGACGSIETAACGEPRVCLGTSSQLPIGVCVSLCSVDGADVDAGVPIAMCTAAQSCVDLDPTDPASPGFCAAHAARGESCEPDLSDGKLCPDTDICAPKDPTADPVEDFRCREDCTTSGTCAAGTCTDVQGEFAYCVD
jgi:hypothetical protein